MQNSSNIPSHLFKIQTWFGKTISQPIHGNNHLSPCDAERYIKPNLKLSSHLRMEIYHQQYWWRLLKCMHTNFPALTRLFGYKAFNRVIAIPYLAEHPPDHWALCHLGHNLSEWTEKCYGENDRELVLNICKIDRSAQASFFALEKPAIEFAEYAEEALLQLKLSLQPHLHLFNLDADLFSFRDQFLKEDVDYWNDHPFPEINYGNQYFAIYRHPNNFVAWKKLSIGEYKMLCSFKEGTTIEKACGKIEQSEKREAEEQLPLWFREWTFLNWLCQWSE